MKQKISITVDEATVKQIEEKVREGFFRNKSHILEFAVKELLRGGKNDRV